LPGAQAVRRRGREVEVLANTDAEGLVNRLRAHAPESLVSEPLSLEEIFVATLQPGAAAA
jgi:hypothetical protein